MGKIFVILAMLWLGAGHVWSQKLTIISGQVISTSGVRLANGTIVLLNGDQKILSFGTTNAEGYYKIAVTDSIVSSIAFVQARYLGFKTNRKDFVKQSGVYNFQLTEDITELNELHVKVVPPIQSSGDTLTYDVASFEVSGDRTIGDIIKRMPGMDVADDGKIYFNGKEIANLYIEGDELMDGRYGLATRAISKDLISAIEVIRNHQPVKVLQNRVLSDKVSVNFVLKDPDSLKLSAQGMTGGGTPRLYQSDLALMTFNRKLKFLDLFKTNTTGIDYSNDFKQQTGGGQAPVTLLSAGAASPPEIGRQNYLHNRSMAGGLNNLFNLAKGVQIRANLYGLGEKNRTEVFGRTDYYLPDDTITFREMQVVGATKRYLGAGVSVMLNKEKLFAQNRLSFDAEKEAVENDLSLRQIPVFQRLLSTGRSFSNEMSIIPSIAGKNVLEFNWLIAIHNKPQSLAVDSGLFPGLVNDGRAYQFTEQTASVPTRLNQMSVTYGIHSRQRFSQRYRVGWTDERQHLGSELWLTQDNGILNRADDAYRNRLNWHRTNWYFSPVYQFKTTKLEAVLTMPFNFQTIAYAREGTTARSQRNDFYPSPELKLKYLAGRKQYMSWNSVYYQNFGGISNVADGGILYNYRSLNRNGAGLPVSTVASTNLEYQLQREIEMLFINANVGYSTTETNLMMNSRLGNGGEEVDRIEKKNRFNTLSAGVGLKKYLFSIGMNSSFKLGWARSSYNQIVNGERFPFYNDSFSVNAGFNGKVHKRVQYTYSVSATNNASRQNSVGGTLSANAFRLVQYGYVSYAPASFLAGIRINHGFNRRPASPDVHYLFLEAEMRYPLKKLKCDLELTVTNLTNARTYDYYRLSANQFSTTTYQLRGRMALLKVNFVL